MCTGRYRTILYIFHTHTSRSVSFGLKNVVIKCHVQEKNLAIASKSSTVVALTGLLSAIIQTNSLTYNNSVLFIMSAVKAVRVSYCLFTVRRNGLNWNYE